MASFAELDKDVVENKGDDEQQQQTVGNIDISTVAYMFDIANAVPEDEVFRKCIVERAENIHIGHLRPHVVFSIRFGNRENDAAHSSRLWAQRHVLAKEGEFHMTLKTYFVNAESVCSVLCYFGLPV